MKIYFNYIKQSFPSKQPTLEQKDDSAQFIKYCLSERTLFVQRFWTNNNQSPSNIETRVMAEDLLLAYDQMLDRIKSHSVKKNRPGRNIFQILCIWINRLCYNLNSNPLNKVSQERNTGNLPA
jgi:hypothetical protein